MYHFIGIGGIGMSALARLLLQKGERVTGSDIHSSPITNDLLALGARISIGHSPDHILPGASVIFSTDIKEDNPEWLFAKEKGLPLLHRSMLLAELMKNKKSLLVSGTHGKTTTSSLLAHVLVDAAAGASFAVGGVMKKYGVNSLWTEGSYFVAEADESDGSFLAYDPFAAIITNIDLDHLNHWISEDNLIQGFKKFAEKVIENEHLVWCKDDKRLSALSLKGISYGFADDADARVSQFCSSLLTVTFSLEFRDSVYKNIELPLLGRHNALNAAAVFVLCMNLGIAEEAIRRAFLSFEGVKRRSEYIGSYGSVKIYDDYAHHPAEIEATLKAFRSAFSSLRLVAVFQPHRYTRTKDCLEDFALAFLSADVVILTDLYSAGEKPIDGIDSSAVFEKVKQSCKGEVFLIKKEILKEFLQGYLQNEDVLLTMGAGDVTKIGPELISQQKEGA